MVTMNGNGACNFRVYLPHAGRVELLGSLTSGGGGGWEDAPREMHPEPGGWWALSSHLPNGDHEFCYLVDGRTWMPDYAATGMKRNSAGNWISLLTIPAPFAPTDHPEVPRRAAGTRSRRRETVAVAANLGAGQ